jgi:CBS domain-containing protein
MDVLKENNILSVPVLLNGKPMGFIDTLDICQYLVHVWNQNRSPTGEVDTSKLPAGFSDAKAQKFINFSGRGAYRYVLEDATLAECIQQMVEYRTHRLGVHSKEHELKGILSQSDILQFANQNINTIPLADKNLEELNMIRGCVMMLAERPLGDILEVLSSEGISAVALVDHEQKLVANFSASDLRGYARAVFSWFHKPTIEYLQNVHKKNLRLPIFESPQSKLSHCVQRLAKERIHRQYVVDKEQRPTGVVSLTDIMPLLLEKEVGQAF